MMNNFLNGMFGKVGNGMCRLSMNGEIAVKTSGGYKSYNIKTGKLTNCNNFVFDIGEEFFFVIPTNKKGRNKENKYMRLYVVSADTYNASWGTQISIFGVFNENHLADALEELQQKYNYNFEVNEANLNECTDIYLGGYLE